jgi:hypothetical protein
MSQKENIITVKNLDTMDSFNNPSTILNNQFAAIVNFIFNGTALKARCPHKQIMAETTSGIWGVLAAHTYTTTSAHKLTYAMPNGKLWYLDYTATVPTEITLASATALSSSNNHACFAQHEGVEYVVDGTNMFSINYSTNAVTSQTAKLVAAGIDAPRFVIAWQSRLWVLDRFGNMVGSEAEVDVSTDGTPFDYTGGASGFYASLNNLDGYEVTGVAIMNQAMVISKINPYTGHGKMHVITGTSEVDFAAKEVAGSVTFLGRSGVAVGEKIFGLTQRGFEFLGTAVEKGEVFSSSDTTSVNKQLASFEGEEVPDVLQDLLAEINSDNYGLIRATYDPALNTYFCSIPAGENADKNNLLVTVNFTNHKIRFALMTGFAADIFLFNGFVHFFSDLGKLWRILDYDQTEYEEEEFHKLIITKKFDWGVNSAEFFIREFVPHLRTYKDDKEIEAYSRVFATEPSSGNILVDTDKAGSSTANNTTTLKWGQSFKPTRWETIIQDLDNYDYLVFDEFRPQVSVNGAGHAVQFILSDYSTGVNEHWDFTGFSLKGHVIKEER